MDERELKAQKAIKHGCMVPITLAEEGQRVYILSNNQTGAFILFSKKIQACALLFQTVRLLILKLSKIQIFMKIKIHVQ